MSRSIVNTVSVKNSELPVGVGLRHPHYKDVMSGLVAVDFLEVHSENFFAEGGMALRLLESVADRYPLSFHGTAMGLGSAAGIKLRYLQQLKALVERFNPRLVSDHASFSWAQVNGQRRHMGDLLPIGFNQTSLKVLSDNVDRVQQFLGRQILVENIVAYIPVPDTEMEETEFFTRLVERTGCGLLLDLNNLLVNARNGNSLAPMQEAQRWLQNVPSGSVKEIHLAGYTDVAHGRLIVDDHSQPVSSECWRLYEYALQSFGSVSTLIEWDNELPAWDVLLNEAEKARQCIAKVKLQQEPEYDYRYTAVG